MKAFQGNFSLCHPHSFKKSFTIADAAAAGSQYRCTGRQQLIIEKKKGLVHAANFSICLQIKQPAGANLLQAEKLH
jgi:hypothetical protein